ncbi:MAG: MmcQ/YjbR family DNA-binding protein [Bacteroidota bacterium]
MNIEQIRDFCLSKNGVTESFPFDEHTLVFKVMGKMYALIALERVPFQVNLKCDPERAVALREEYDGVIIPGYHMSKTHWNTIYVEQLPPHFIKELINHSYQLVVEKLPKKTKEELSRL